MASVLYIDVTTAAAETAAKVIRQRTTLGGKPVKVSVTATGGGSAYCTVTPKGEVTIGLPSLAADSVLGRGEADRILGYIAHECLHVLYTDWSVWHTAVRHGERVKRWVNCLEDVRIEAKEIKAGAYPALRGLLASVTDHMHYQDSVKVAPYRIGAKLADAPYCVAVLGRAANGYVMPSTRTLSGAVPAHVKPLLELALREVKGCRSTQHCLDLALRLVAMEQTLAAPTAPPAPPKPKPETGEDEAGEAGEDEAGEAGEDEAGEAGEDEAGEAGEDEAGEAGEGEAGEGEAGEGEAGEGEAGEGEAGEGEAGEGEAGEGEAGEGEAGDDPGLDPTATLDDIAARVAGQAGQDPARLEPKNGLHGYRNTVSREVVDIRRSGESLTVARAMDELLPGRAVLAGQISRLLVAPEKTWTTHRETSGRLDRRALARLGTGAMDVFSQKHEQMGTDTALLVLIDGSGSMRNGGRWALAMLTAFHLASAAEQAGAMVGVTVFYSEPDTQSAPGATLVPLVLPGQPVRGNAARFVLASPRAFTPLSPAILGGAETLLDVNATRRIQMVITDGDCDLGAACVTQACNIAATWGVETVGVGIAAPDVIKAFPDGHSVNVRDLRQLGATGLGVLCDMLEEQGAET